MTMQRWLSGQTLRIACPYCRDHNGEPKFHTHGSGGKPGPWHRLAHCVEANLPAHLRARQRSGQFLCYEITADEPRVIAAPPLVPDLPRFRRGRF
jgi:hypothetical protein